MFSLSGKACVVTGASRGIGRAIALAFADQGADLVLAARSRNDLEEVRHLIEARGRRAVSQVTDVTNLDQLRAAADACVTHLGKIDVWVNNAGGFTAAAGSASEWLDVTAAGGSPASRPAVVSAAAHPSARRRRRRRGLPGL